MAHFLAKKSAEFGVAAPDLNDDAYAALASYGFPGNVRELENILERALTLCENAQIKASDLRLPQAPTAAPGAGATAELQDYLDDVERQRILAALEQTRWNKTKAAKLLGISFRALRYRLQKLSIEA